MDEDRILNKQHTIEEAMCKINHAIQNSVNSFCSRRPDAGLPQMPETCLHFLLRYAQFLRCLAAAFIKESGVRFPSLLDALLKSFSVQQNYVLHLLYCIMLRLPQDHQRL